MSGCARLPVKEGASVKKLRAEGTGNAFAEAAFDTGGGPPALLLRVESKRFRTSATSGSGIGLMSDRSVEIKDEAVNRKETD